MQTPLREFFSQYCEELMAYLKNLAVTDAAGNPIDAMAALEDLTRQFRRVHDRGEKVIWLGNGGSAGMASHHAFDYWKNGRVRSVTFNDASLLTGSGNDYGYPHVFAEPVKMFAKPGDIIIAISSSGKSPNIVNAAWEGRKLGCVVVTLSAFGEENPLRKAGTLNIYLRTPEYGFAEIGHHVILHSLLDYLLMIEKNP